MSWSHRPALDGLRTLAVYLVLLFHCGVGWFDGGFLGVDLFFVLSGFLVSSILLEELESTGRLRLGRFYGRRVRRLLPAAIVVVLATSAVFLLLSSTVKRLPWVGDAEASLLYVANWRFLLQSNDYFAADVDRSPFLHFWSLSIEEQFYFAFPLILLLLFKLRARWRPAVVAGVAALTALSLGAQVYWASADSNHAYYGTDARIYQLLAGVLVALAWRRMQGREVRAPGAGWVLLAALLLTASSLVSFSVSVRGVIAAVASAGLILAVMAQTDRSLVGWLNRPTMTYLGQISYGTYLWHWPVILAFTEVIQVGPWVLTALVSAVATGLAAASYQLLEMPIRRSRALAPFGFSALAVGVACSAVVAFTVVPTLLQQDRRPVLQAAAAPVTGTELNADRPVPRGIDWERYRLEKGAGTYVCTPEDQDSCVAVEGGSGLHVAVVGDSHARQLASVMIPLAEEHDFTLSLNVMGGCPWQLGVNTPTKIEQTESPCIPSRIDLYESVLADMDVDVVVLAQNAREKQRQLRRPDGSKTDLEVLNLETMTTTLERLEELDLEVVMVETMLRPNDPDPFNPLSCLSEARRSSECRVKAPPEVPYSDSIYQVLAIGQPDRATVNINPVMCPAWPVCDPIEGRIPVWRDSAHYSADALVLRKDEIWDLFLKTGYFDAAS